jgi:uncharacterized delta-60 repeat protein
VAVQPDGKIVVVGSTQNDPSHGVWAFQVVPFNADGTLDQGFRETPSGLPGRAVANFARYDVAAGVVIQPDGHIVVAGTTRNNLPSDIGDFQLVRFNPSGTVDGDFGPDKNGRATLNFNRGDDVVAGVQLDPDGQIVTAGTVGDKLGSSTSGFAFSRHHGDSTR